MGGGGGLQNLGVGGTNFQLLMLSPNLLKKKKKIFAKNFLVFGQKCAWEWFSTLNTEWFAMRSIANHKNYFHLSKEHRTKV